MKVGDKVRCIGIGYPQWKGEIFEITAVFDDGRIGIRGCIRVGAEDFELINEE